MLSLIHLKRIPPCVADERHVRRNHFLSDEHSCCWTESINDTDFFQNLASEDLKKSEFISCAHVNAYGRWYYWINLLLSLANGALSFPAYLLRAQ